MGLSHASVGVWKLAMIVAVIIIMMTFGQNDGKGFYNKAVMKLNKEQGLRESPGKGSIQPTKKTPPCAVFSCYLPQMSPECTRARIHIFLVFAESIFTLKIDLLIGGGPKAKGRKEGRKGGRKKGLKAEEMEG